MGKTKYPHTKKLTRAELEKDLIFNCDEDYRKHHILLLDYADNAERQLYYMGLHKGIITNNSRLK